MSIKREELGFGIAELDRPTINPVKALRKRNRKINMLLAAVGFALAAACLVLAAPEIGFAASVMGSLLAGSGSALLTVIAKK